MMFSEFEAKFTGFDARINEIEDHSNIPIIEENEVWLMPKFVGDKIYMHYLVNNLIFYLKLSFYGQIGEIEIKSNRAKI